MNYAKLEQSFERFICKNYEASVEHSRSCVGSNSFYIKFETKDGRGGTIKISDHNTIWQQQANRSTIFIDGTGFKSFKEIKSVVVRVLDENGAVKTCSVYKKIVQIENKIAKIDQERDNAFIGKKQYAGMPRAERMEIWLSLHEKQKELYSQISALEATLRHV